MEWTICKTQVGSSQGPGIGSVTHSLRVLESLHCMYCRMWSVQWAESSAVHSTHTALFSPLADLARFNRARPCWVVLPNVVRSVQSRFRWGPKGISSSLIFSIHQSSFS